MRKYLIPNKEFKIKRCPIFIMLFPAIICLSFRSKYHLIGIMSEKINSFQVDLIIVGYYY